jgi:hypothetical protein
MSKEEFIMSLIYGFTLVPSAAELLEIRELLDKEIARRK